MNAASCCHSDARSLPLLVMYVVNWFRATRLQTFDATGSSDTGQLLFAISWSPSLSNGPGWPQNCSNGMEKLMTIETSSRCLLSCHGQVPYWIYLFIYYNLMAVSKVKAIRTICKRVTATPYKNKSPWSEFTLADVLALLNAWFKPAV